MRWLRDIRENLSWTVGYDRGQAGQSYSCPWWVDRIVFAFAYTEGYMAYLSAGGKPLPS